MTETNNPPTIKGKVSSLISKKIGEILFTPKKFKIEQMNITAYPIMNSKSINLNADGLFLLCFIIVMGLIGYFFCDFPLRIYFF